MKTYFGNGIVKEIPYFLNDDSIFAIQELDSAQAGNRFVYPGDSIKYELDLALVDLYDVFRDLVFEDMKLFYCEQRMIPEKRCLTP